MTARRAGALLLTACALIGCRYLPKRKSVQDAGVADAAVSATPTDAGSFDAGVRILTTEDLPLGHWQSTEGVKFGITILPDGLVRFFTDVPSYRNGARVFGKVTEAISPNTDPDAIQIWVDVTKIYAKEIGPAHRRMADFELFEADVLGERVTSHNENAQKIPQLGGKGVEAPRGYALQFSNEKLHLAICTLNTPPQCRDLEKAKSPSDISRVRTNGTCKVDEDCVLATDGEQCDPCLCPSQASLKSWPTRAKPDDSREDLSWERTTEHLCGKEIQRRDDCGTCPTLHAVCKSKVCILKGT